MKKIHIVVLMTLMFVTGMIVYKVFFYYPSEVDEKIEIYIIEKQENRLFQGIVEAENIQEENLNLQINQLKELAIVNEQEVKEGEILFTYQPKENSILELEYALKRARMNLRASEKEFSEVLSRQNKEGNSEITSMQESDFYEVKLSQLQHEVELQKLTVEETEQRLINAKEQNTVIKKANVTGIVYFENTNDELKIKVYSNNTIVVSKVSEYDYEELKLNQQVEVMTANQKNKTTGEIFDIAKIPDVKKNDSDVTHYTFKTKLAQKLNNGSRVHISIENNDIMIPHQAVEGNTVIKKLDNGQEEPVVIEMEKTYGRIKVLSGLRIGDKIKLKGANDD